MWNKLRRHLVVKLLISYLVVVLVGTLVQAIATQIVIPGVYQRHMAGMQNMMGMMGDATGLDMFGGFRSGVNEALAVAALAASLAAIVVSVLISRRVVAPIQAITKASLQIADGHFDQRLHLSDGNPEYADELGRLAQAFNQMAERLEHTEQMRLQLLGDVSHELRTPLTVIKGSMEALVDGVLPAEKATFEQIEQEADRLQRLVNDLQELSRVEAGAYELDRRPISVETLVQTAIQRIERQFQQKNILLTSHMSPNLPSMQGDQDRLLQVLMNLLSNAYQYTPTGGEVHVQVDLKGDKVVISIQDNGIGISAEHISQLFTRFYRVDKSRSRQAGGGSGIGLTIAKHLVEAHGGRIWVESEGPGMGSTFSFTLPTSRS
jgi:two-component system sensor histidine kinase BaeS